MDLITQDLRDILIENGRTTARLAGSGAEKISPRR